MPEIILKLPPPMVQLILNVLAERPYRESAETIATVMEQANAQLAAAPPSHPPRKDAAHD